jgi:hypothetical protein
MAQEQSPYYEGGNTQWEANTPPGANVETDNAQGQKGGIMSKVKNILKGGNTNNPETVVAGSQELGTGETTASTTGLNQEGIVGGDRTFLPSGETTGSTTGLNQGIAGETTGSTTGLNQGIVGGNQTFLPSASPGGAAT